MDNDPNLLKLADTSCTLALEALSKDDIYSAELEFCTAILAANIALYQRVIEHYETKARDPELSSS